MRTGTDHEPALNPRPPSALPVPSGPCVYLCHILFTAAPGQDAHALRVQAERVLLALTCTQAEPDRFARLASQWSACPSAQQWGELGWVRPQDCAPELANELFEMREPAWGMGVHPRLVHTDQGVHIVRVLGRRRPSPTDLPFSS